MSVQFSCNAILLAVQFYISVQILWTIKHLHVTCYKADDKYELLIGKEIHLEPKVL